MTVTALADCVPLANSVYAANGQKPVVEFEMAGTHELPVHRQGEDEQAFFAKWEELQAPYAICEGESIVFLLLRADRSKIGLGSLEDMYSYYTIS